MMLFPRFETGFACCILVALTFYCCLLLGDPEALPGFRITLAEVGIAYAAGFYSQGHLYIGV
jgi:hypothetical protein